MEVNKKLLKLNKNSSFCRDPELQNYDFGINFFKCIFLLKANVAI